MGRTCDEVALVTGAAGGMGAACARELHARAKLILTDRDGAGLARLRADLGAGSGEEPSVVAADLGDEAGLTRVLDEVRRAGGMRWLVHTAGLSPTMAPWHEVLQVDLAATARLLRRAIDQMAPGGAAVCFASAAGHMASDASAVDAVLDDPLAPDLPGRLAGALGSEPDPGIAYVYAKRGVIRLCERWAEAWGRRGVRLVSLSPGLVDTPMGRRELAENPAKEALLHRVPLVRPSVAGPSRLSGHVDDVAAAVSFLCSDAASFVSGCDLRVDGGLIGALRS